MPLEWSGHHNPSSLTPQAHCLPLKASVGPSTIHRRVIAMALYEVGFIVVRCHIQKRLSLGSHVEAVPLGATGFAGDIHTARKLLISSGFNFTRRDLDSALAHFRDAEHAALVKMPEIEASSYIGLAEFRVRGFRARQGRIYRPAHAASRDHSITPIS
jgi:hypothetical protein